MTEILTDKLTEVAQKLKCMLERINGITRCSRVNLSEFLFEQQKNPEFRFLNFENSYDSEEDFRYLSLSFARHTDCPFIIGGREDDCEEKDINGVHYRWGDHCGNWSKFRVSFTKSRDTTEKAEFNMGLRPTEYFGFYLRPNAKVLYADVKGVCKTLADRGCVGPNNGIWNFETELTKYELDFMVREWEIMFPWMRKIIKEKREYFL